MDWVSFVCGFVAAFVFSALVAVVIAPLLFSKAEEQSDWRGNPRSKKDDKA